MTHLYTSTQPQDLLYDHWPHLRDFIYKDLDLPAETKDVHSALALLFYNHLRFKWVEVAKRHSEVFRNFVAFRHPESHRYLEQSRSLVRVLAQYLLKRVHVYPSTDDSIRGEDESRQQQSRGHQDVPHHGT